MLKDTSVNWKKSNPIIPKDVKVYETDTNYIKIGDGIKLYKDLPIAGYDDVNSIENNSAAFEFLKKNRTAWINVVEFAGIDNTGTVDVTVAIRNILNLAVIPVGSIIYFPKGKYLISGNINIPKQLTLRGDSHYHAPYNAGKDFHDQTKFIVADSCENVTIITKSGEYDRVSVMGITLVSTSARVTGTGFIASAGNPGTPWLYTEYKPNVNGIDIHNGNWGGCIMDVFVDGFSGTGIYCPGDGTVNNIYATNCGLGAIIYTDTTGTNIRTQYCNNGIKFSGGSISCSNIRVEEIANIGVTTENAFRLQLRNLVIDHCVYNGMVIGAGTNQITIKGTITRCGLYYYGSTLADLTADQKKSVAKIRVTGACYCSYFTLTNLSTDTSGDANPNITWQTYLFSLEAQFEQNEIRVPFHIPYIYTWNDGWSAYTNILGQYIYKTVDVARYILKAGIYTYTIENACILSMGDGAIGSTSNRYPLRPGEILYDAIAGKAYVARGITKESWKEIQLVPIAFNSTYPKAGAAQAVGSKTVELLVKCTDNGTAYYVVVADNATAPTVAQVMTGKNNAGAAALAAGSSAVTTGVEKSFITAALPADATAYDIYVVAKDNFGYTQASVTKVDVTTPAAT